MKRLLFILFMFSLFVNVSAQDYDLIVKTNGDSIACYIDSLTDSKAYFKMKTRDKWVATNMDVSQLASYQMNAVYKRRVVFETGSSIILRSENENASIQTIPRNAVFLGIAFVAYTFNYEHIFPLSSKLGISLRGGLGYDFYNQNPIVQEEVNLIVGGPRAFFELGIGHQFPGQAPGFLILRPGFRYQSFKGFLLKAYPMFMLNLDNDADWKYWGFVGASLGYSF